MKTHYPTLDGLRGIAAIMVILFHLFESNTHDFTANPIHRGYLAVDFFFMLSGFVIGYAYDDRWQKMTFWGFCKIRVVRLHPLLVLGTTIGALLFMFDPYTDGMARTSILALGFTSLVSLTLLPSRDIRGWGETHSLNGACWSLFQEYVGNLLYALFVRKFSRLMLTILVIFCGMCLLAVSHYKCPNGIGVGWSWNFLWVGFTRMMFPFFAGLLLHRMGGSIRIPSAFPCCALALVTVFCLPYFTVNGFFTHNALLDALMIIFIFPLIVAVGAGGEVSRQGRAVCRFLGEISYPLYSLHYPFIYAYGSWIKKTEPTFAQSFLAGLSLFIFFILLAYVALKSYDEPIRAWLRKRFVTIHVIKKD